MSGGPGLEGERALVSQWQAAGPGVQRHQRDTRCVRVYGGPSSFREPLPQLCRACCGVCGGEDQRGMVLSKAERLPEDPVLPKQV